MCFKRTGFANYCKTYYPFLPIGFFGLLHASSATSLEKVALYFSSPSFFLTNLSIQPHIGFSPLFTLPSLLLLPDLIFIKNHKHTLLWNREDYIACSISEDLA